MTPPSTSRWDARVRSARAAGRLVVQPRMGFGELARIRTGLRAVRAARATTVGTVTLDSYTRVGDHDAARRALVSGADLNGFPLLVHGPHALRDLLDELAGDDFPVQIRHGSALPERLFQAMAEAGVDATEGGPVSYCLPYGRVPLAKAVAAWGRGCELLAAQERPPHLETFGGCMLGQLCPPSLLVALSVLEAMFFREHGLRSVSLSYAQQTHTGQDLEALAALRRLAEERLGPPSPHPSDGDGEGSGDWHIVLYTYMGLYPRTPTGAYRLLEESIRLAVHGGAERLIVKTAAEAHRIPTVEENIDALEFAASVARDPGPAPRPADTGVYEEARTLVDTTLELADGVGAALVAAFARGRLDVPFCLHPDNAGRSRSYIDPHGLLRWSDAGAMPVWARPPVTQGAFGPPTVHGRLTARGLIDLLGRVARRYDGEHLTNVPLRSPS